MAAPRGEGRRVPRRSAFESFDEGSWITDVRARLRAALWPEPTLPADAPMADASENDSDGVHEDPQAKAHMRRTADAMQELLALGGIVDEEKNAPIPMDHFAEHVWRVDQPPEERTPSSLFSAFDRGSGTDIDALLRFRLAESERARDAPTEAKRTLIEEIGNGTDAARAHTDADGAPHAAREVLRGEAPGEASDDSEESEASDGSGESEASDESDESEEREESEASEESNEREEREATEASEESEEREEHEASEASETSEGNDQGGDRPNAKDVHAGPSSSEASPNDHASAHKHADKACDAMERRAHPHASHMAHDPSFEPEAPDGAEDLSDLVADAEPAAEAGTPGIPSAPLSWTPPAHKHVRLPTGGKEDAPIILSDSDEVASSSQPAPSDRYHDEEDNASDGAQEAEREAQEESTHEAAQEATQDPDADDLVEDPREFADPSVLQDDEELQGDDAVEDYDAYPSAETPGDHEALADFDAPHDAPPPKHDPAPVSTAPTMRPSSSGHAPPHGAAPGAEERADEMHETAPGAAPAKVTFEAPSRFAPGGLHDEGSAGGPSHFDRPHEHAAEPVHQANISDMRTGSSSQDTSPTGPHPEATDVPALPHRAVPDQEPPSTSDDARHVAPSASAALNAPTSTPPLSAEPTETAPEERDAAPSAAHRSMVCGRSDTHRAPSPVSRDRRSSPPPGDMQAHAPQRAHEHSDTFARELASEMGLTLGEREARDATPDEAWTSYAPPLAHADLPLASLVPDDALAPMSGDDLDPSPTLLPNEFWEPNWAHTAPDATPAAERAPAPAPRADTDAPHAIPSPAPASRGPSPGAELDTSLVARPASRPSDPPSGTLARRHAATGHLTRSHCALQRVTLLRAPGAPTFLVRACALNPDVLAEEGAEREDLYLDRLETVPLDADALPEPVYHALCRIVGPDLLDDVQVLPTSLAAQWMAQEAASRSASSASSADEAAHAQPAASEARDASPHPRDGTRSPPAGHQTYARRHRRPRKSDPSSSVADYLPPDAPPHRPTSPADVSITELESLQAPEPKRRRSAASLSPPPRMRLRSARERRPTRPFAADP